VNFKLKQNISVPDKNEPWSPFIPASFVHRPTQEKKAETKPVVTESTTTESRGSSESSSRDGELDCRRLRDIAKEARKKNISFVEEVARSLCSLLKNNQLL